MAMETYCPEMGDTKPTTQIEAHLSHYGKHWFLKTPLALSGRGVVHLKTLTASDLVPSAHSKIGWHQYKVTDAAFEKIKAQHSVSVECYL